MKWIGNIVAVALFAPILLTAAEDRITGRIENTRMVALQGHLHPKALAANDRGPVDGSMELSYLTLRLKPAPSLERFLLEQQNPSSPNYHQWLTPEEFADRFGLSPHDVAQVTAWLTSQGMRVHDVARGRHWITFSGASENIGRAFRTRIHRYSVGGETHYANATEPSIPASLDSVVAGLDGLNDFVDKPLHRVGKIAVDAPLYNSGTSHYLAPDDFATIYNLKPLYDAGIDGTGQKIAVIGRTDIKISDIQAFRTRFGLPPNDPQVVLFGPDPGTLPLDEVVEANLDVEWSGAVARNATIIFVNSRNTRISAQYAVDQNLAPVITYSFGLCEQYDTPAFRAVAQQANAQGITFMVASGDQAAATCDVSSPTAQAAKGATVSSPASIPEVTSVGGTRFDEGDGSYWAARNNASGASALSYIPEKAWNETVDGDLLAGSGGGPSAFFSKPVWQTGPGVPNDNARDIPDVSLSASLHDAYLVTAGSSLFPVGGTSAGSPAFAGIVALLNQYLVSKKVLSQPGLGNINPMLYRLAQAAPDAFHDITSGDNKAPCVQSSPACVDGLVGFASAPGYDQATGLGSIDAYNLVTKWNIGAASATSLNASPGKVTLDDTVRLIATVTAPGAAPTGSVTFIANDTLLGTARLATAGAATTATLSVPAIRIVGGNGAVSALYSGDAVLNPSGGSATVTLTLPASGSMVVPAIGPNPVYQQADSTGPGWIVHVTLTEKAGVATRLTGFTIDGTDYTSRIARLFGSSTIRANGSISAGVILEQLTPPFESTFVFEGVDADGAKWSRKITASLVGPAAPALFPNITVSGTPGTVVQNPQAGPSCQWTQQLTVQETGGFLVMLDGLTIDGVDYTGRIQQIFGTTRVAPLGSLMGTICWSAGDIVPPATKTIQLSGTAEEDSAVVATLSTAFRAAPASAAAFTISPESVTIPVSQSSQSGAATLSLKFAGSAPSWNVAILPSNGTTGWLSVSPISGSGDGQVNLKASGTGLSKGVYRAVLAIQSTGTVPGYLNVPVTFVVGASSSTVITGLRNNFSGRTAYAPGMMLAVYGTELAPPSTSILASRLPLPLTVAGVSATVNGIAAPLYYVSPVQLDVQIPYEAGAGPSVLSVNNNGQVAAFPFTISVAAPGMAVAPDGSLFPASARQGQAYAIYITGEGDVTPFLPTGAAPVTGTPASRLPKPRLPLAVTVGGVDATITFVGLPTWGAGVTQINFTVPTNAPLGAQPVVVKSGDIPSPPGTLTITAATP